MVDFDSLSANPLVENFRLYIGKVHIGARALLDIDMVWLSLAYPIGEKGGKIYSFKLFIHVVASLRGGGVSTQHPLAMPLWNQFLRELYL
jgi:hypothetical protein